MITEKDLKATRLRGKIAREITQNPTETYQQKMESIFRTKMGPCLSAFDSEKTKKQKEIVHLAFQGDGIRKKKLGKKK